MDPHDMDWGEDQRVQSLLEHLGALETMILPQEEKGDDDSDSNDGTNKGEGIPLLLAVTGLPNIVFQDETARTDFEMLFTNIDPHCHFTYLRSFPRVHVTMSSQLNALLARMQLHRHEVCGVEMNVYFAQWARIAFGGDSLQLPQPYKAFLISPPASPPVGWEQSIESEPVVNYDILSALSTLAPGEDHTLHPGCEHKQQPSIVITPCETPDISYSPEPAPKPKIIQTRCPARRF